MADPTDPFSLNVLGVTDLVQNPINKVSAGAGYSPEGPVGDKEDVLSFDMSDEDLLKLKESWETKYAGYKSKHDNIVKKNLESYLGKRANGQWLAGDLPLAANIQFEAEETFLAATLSKNPEPVVYADNTEMGNAVANAVKTMLAYHADRLVIRRKLSLMVRQWSIHHLGVIKVGWNKAINDVAVENRKIQNFVFDPEGYVDAYGDFIGYLGEQFETTADVLVKLFPEHAAYIKLTTDNKLGTKVVYTEWCSPDNTFFFTTYKEKVLDKFKNPYFLYPEAQKDQMTGEPTLDETGEPVMTEPRNHFAVPKKPFIFLSVYSLQEQPHDITGLIEQNIANQNLITRRTDQIDYNISKSNNSYAYSEDNFDQETAKQAATAHQKGNQILVPQGGPIEKAIWPLPAQSLPNDAFNQLVVSKSDLKSSWGIEGITPDPEDDKTARGMILNQSHDTSRIGGGIGQGIEQVADNMFNWLTQLYYVFYDEKHWAAVMGTAKAVEFITISNQDLDRQLIVSVAPDSLKPKDDVTNMNLAQALFDKGAIGPKTLLKMLDFPDPDASAADGVLFKIDPMAYLHMNWPDLAQQMMQVQQQKAALDAANQANASGMKTAATAANTPPEQLTEPNGTLSQEPANASLSQVPLNG